jgi:hypothetical protein
VRARLTWFLADTGALSDLAGVAQMLDRVLAAGPGWPAPGRTQHFHP